MDSEQKYLISLLLEDIIEFTHGSFSNMPSFLLFHEDEFSFGDLWTESFWL
jgi:hypothetical protein